MRPSHGCDSRGTVPWEFKRFKVDARSYKPKCMQEAGDAVRGIPLRQVVVTVETEDCVHPCVV